MPKKLKSIYLTEEVWSQLKQRAVASGVNSTNKLIAHIIDEFISQRRTIKIARVSDQTKQIRE
jgi:hypothetical protein